MVEDPEGDKLRCNKIILGEKYLLSDPKTYDIFGLKYPTLEYAITNGFIELSICLINTRYYKYILDDIFIFSACRGKLGVVKYLVEEKHIDIDMRNGEALKQSAGNGHLDVVKYLIEHGADICKNYCCIFRLVNDCDHSLASNCKCYEIKNYLSTINFKHTNSCCEN